MSNWASPIWKTTVHNTSHLFFKKKKKEKRKETYLTVIPEWSIPKNGWNMLAEPSSEKPNVGDNYPLPCRINEHFALVLIFTRKKRAPEARFAVEAKHDQ